MCNTQSAWWKFYSFAKYFLPTIEADFIGDVITVTLPQPGSDGSGEVEVEIPIIDDVIYEELEQFLGYIEIVNAVDMETIVLGRNTTQLIIANDNDSKQCMLTHIYISYSVCAYYSWYIITITVAYGPFCIMNIFNHAL